MEEDNFPMLNETSNPQDKIYEVATDRGTVDWKSFLHDLIYKEGLDPWNIDVSILTKKYLEALKELKKVDFDISGKFLTVAVFLLKIKAENLIEKDLRGIDEKIMEAQSHNQENFEDELESLEDLDSQIDSLDGGFEQGNEYSLKIRNPIARKRRVNIFDLIKTLEKTIEQSNKRRMNFLEKKEKLSYDGPDYDKKPKDLKSLIEDIFEVILNEFSSKKSHMTFNEICGKKKERMHVLDKFIPLLHLHNQSRVELKQKEHFGDIYIHLVNNKLNKGESFEDI